MRPLREIKLTRLVDSEKAFWGEAGAAERGMFALRVNGEECHVIASCDGGWDHVSVSFEHRTPTWAEMEGIKRLFFRPTETAMQLHVPVADHINCNPHVLHIWRPHDCAIPLPPKDMV